MTGLGVSIAGTMSRLLSLWVARCLLMAAGAIVLPQVRTWESTGIKVRAEGITPSMKSLQRIVPAGKRSLWATSGKAGALVSDDGGRSWRAVQPFPPRSNVESLHFL